MRSIITKGNRIKPITKATIPKSIRDIDIPLKSKPKATGEISENRHSPVGGPEEGVGEARGPREADAKGEGGAANGGGREGDAWQKRCRGRRAAEEKFQMEKMWATEEISMTEEIEKSKPKEMPGKDAPKEDKH
ncbi:glutathione S-transferase THETA 2 [Striga asiatica]|uniref:Glutathione S-transferase THETA 2 n=1 Tax=Striga asiatica TaxID=4170 RepID=A0A5A7QRH3_STRAF|nr:glutathione S-transferase THETA 2 [Striga asiatica]